MRKSTAVKSILGAIALATCSACDSSMSVEIGDGMPLTKSDWALDEASSRLSFVSIKGGDIAEVHRFDSISGRVASNGTATLAIPLDSVNTAVDIRNERMREFLFETGTYPQATITAELDTAAFAQMEIDARAVQPVTFELDLHGMTAELDADVFVTRVDDDEVLVETTGPVFVYAEDFALGAGVAKLMELAGLDAITPTVPVTASLLFKRTE